MVGADFQERWYLLLTDRLGVLAARVKVAARRRAGRAGHLTLKRDFIQQGVRIRFGNCGQERFRIRVLGVQEELLRLRLLHNLADIT